MEISNLNLSRMCERGHLPIHCAREWCIDAARDSIRLQLMKSKSIVPW